MEASPAGPEEGGVQGVLPVGGHDHLGGGGGEGEGERVEMKEVKVVKDPTLTLVVWSKPSIWLRSSSRMRCTSLSAPVCASNLRTGLHEPFPVYPLKIQVYTTKIQLNHNWFYYSKTS